MGRWLAGRLMKELGLVSCQQPTYRYKRGGHEHVAIVSSRLTGINVVVMNMLLSLTTLNGSSP